MFCVIQEIKCKKSNKYGYPKEVIVKSTESEVRGKVQKNYDLVYSDERFERPVKKSYKISVQESYRENGKVKKRQSVICTVKYYDLALGDFNLYEWAEEAIIKVAEKFNVSEEKIWELVEEKVNRLEDEVQVEFHSTEEYLVHEKHEEMISNYYNAKNSFNEMWGTPEDRNPYDRCFDINGEMKDFEEYERVVNEAMNGFEQRQKQKRSYQNQKNGNYAESEKKMLKSFYVMLSHKFHPDNNPDKDTTKEMQLLNKLKADWGV